MSSRLGSFISLTFNPLSGVPTSVEYLVVVGGGGGGNNGTSSTIQVGVNGGSGIVIIKWS